MKGFWIFVPASELPQHLGFNILPRLVAIAQCHIPDQFFHFFAVDGFA